MNIQAQPVINLSGYRFVRLDHLFERKEKLTLLCSSLSLRGTILLSSEGVNINLAGIKDSIDQLKICLDKDPLIAKIPFHETYSDAQPFQKLKVKVKKEIIAFREPNVQPLMGCAKRIQPEELKQWLDEGREITVLDTRNTYEVALGTFTGSIHLSLKHFIDFSEAVQKLDRHQPIVTFCTGGIRCEKAALYMQQQGFEEVYQLNGGILGYFAKVGKTHFEGSCFVFDERESLGLVEISRELV